MKRAVAVFLGHCLELGSADVGPREELSDLASEVQSPPIAGDVDHSNRRSCHLWPAPEFSSQQCLEPRRFCDAP